MSFCSSSSISVISSPFNVQINRLVIAVKQTMRLYRSCILYISSLLSWILRNIKCINTFLSFVCRRSFYIVQGDQFAVSQSTRNISSEQFDKMDGAWNHFVTFVKWDKKKWSRFNPPSNPSNLPQGPRSSSHGLVESGSNAKEMSVNIEDILLRVQFFNMAASHSGALWNIRVSSNGTRNLKEAKVNENWVNHKLHQDISWFSRIEQQFLNFLFPSEWNENGVKGASLFLCLSAFDVKWIWAGKESDRSEQDRKSWNQKLLLSWPEFPPWLKWSEIKFLRYFHCVLSGC